MDKKYDDMLEKAVALYVEEQLDSDLYSKEKFETSEKFDYQMKALLNSQKKSSKSKITPMKKVLCALVAALILMFSLLSVGAVREMLAGFFVSSYENHQVVESIPKSNKIYPKLIDKYYTLAGKKVNEIRTLKKNEAIYNYKNSRIYFAQMTKSNFSLDLKVDSRNTVKYQRVIDNQTYLIYKSSIKVDNKKIMEYIYVWDNGEYIFCLKGDVDSKEMKNLCRSVKSE